jgi:hypothetical protein
MYCFTNSPLKIIWGAYAVNTGFHSPARRAKRAAHLRFSASAAIRRYYTRKFSAAVRADKIPPLSTTNTLGRKEKIKKPFLNPVGPQGQHYNSEIITNLFGYNNVLFMNAVELYVMHR